MKESDIKIGEIYYCCGPEYMQNWFIIVKDIDPVKMESQLTGVIVWENGQFGMGYSQTSFDCVQRVATDQERKLVLLATIC